MEPWTPLEAQSEDSHHNCPLQNRFFEWAGPGLGWPGLAWAGLGWPGLACAVLVLCLQVCTLCLHLHNLLFNNFCFCWSFLASLVFEFGLCVVACLVCACACSCAYTCLIVVVFILCAGACLLVVLAVVVVVILAFVVLHVTGADVSASICFVALFSMPKNV